MVLTKETAASVLALLLVLVVPITLSGLWKESLSGYLVPTQTPKAAGESRGVQPGLQCVEPPLCDSPRLTLRGLMVCAMRRQPLQTGSRVYRQYARERLRSLLPRFVRGQLSLGSIMAAVERKLLHPEEPLVMHFAGDNGVGKTRTAEAISLAVGQRCARSGCTLGDSTLVLSGTSYDGLSIAEFRRAVVPAIVRHARAFPGNGVLLINELTSLDQEKVRLLMPVLGRGNAFPEHPEVDLSALIVIVTTDFGREGRTQGRSMEEMRAFISAEFRELYSQTSASNIRVFPFLPVSLQTAAEIAAEAVLEMGCSTCGRPVAASEDTVSLLVERVKPILAVENGRAVVQQVVESVGGLLDKACVEEEGAGAVDISVGLNDGGDLVAVVSSPSSRATKE